jgi:mitochondrial import receptor subunit TOM20
MMQSISISKTAGIAFGAGIAFIGYCIYFDHKRRGAKDFKKKLHDKRQDREKKFKSKGKTSSKLPDLTGEFSIMNTTL